MLTKISQLVNGRAGIPTQGCPTVERVLVTSLCTFSSSSHLNKDVNITVVAVGKAPQDMVGSRLAGLR